MPSQITTFFERTKKIIRRLKAEAAKIKAEEHELKTMKRNWFSARAVTSGQTHAKVDISTTSVVKATLAIFGLATLAYLLFAIKDILILFAIAAFFAIAFEPSVSWLNRRLRLPRWLGILLIYVAVIGLFGIVIASLIPILTTEIPNLVASVMNWLHQSFGIDTSIVQAQLTELQKYLNNIQTNLNKENIATGLNILSTISQNTIAILKSVAGGVFSFTMILVITFFMIVEEDGIKKFLIALFPARYHTYIIEKASVVEDKFGGWLRGQLLLMCVIGVSVFIGLKLVGMNYAATLGMLAGLTELIPYVGPTLGLIPALILAGSQDGLFLMFLVTLVYVVVQQLENNFLVPIIMKKAVGLSPIIVMFAMLVGASFPETLNPIVGIILAVPVATAISVFVHDYTEKKK